jgi:pimeloyl-ACP methyl ester carboxylesterase
MTLSDGRTLAFYEYGDKRGVPCIYIPGTPVSGLAGAAYNDAALSAGVRWISVDKPGYGHSDFNPSGTLLSFCDDVTELANHLGLDRFAVAGESGGGPYALALAYRRADRLTVSLILAGMGPGRERWARKGMRPSNRLLLMAAQRASWLLRPMMKALAWMVADDKRSARIGARQAKRLPAADRAIYDQFGHVDALSVRDSFRQGIAGSLREAEILAAPWGFRVEDIRARVELWHGSADVNVPIALAEHVCQRVPNCMPHYLQGVGHAAGHVAAGHVMTTVTRAAAGKALS